jgi:peptide/nickel transport system ATP-binding protein
MMAMVAPAAPGIDVATSPVLQIRELSVHYTRKGGADPSILDGVSLDVHRGEILGLAGESGSGKSTMVESILRLLEPPRYVRSGRVLFQSRSATDPVDLMRLPESRLRAIRWRGISYIPQGSMNSLNPVLRVRDQIADAMIDHGVSKREARAHVPGALKLVGLDDAVARLYPHQLSGGMKQRAIIAAAIAMRPDLVIADEITTALDVNVQRLILETLMHIRDELGVAVVFVSHDMAVHAEIADRLAVMYAGKVIEVGSVLDVFKQPLHPYAQGLIQSIPSVQTGQVRLSGIPGVAPSPTNWPSGCRFHPRCPHAMAICRSLEPLLATIQPGHVAACHLYPESRGEAGDGH